MKCIDFLLTPLVLFGSCAGPVFYHARINDIPTRTPNFNTEIRFIEDSLPTEPYFEIIDIDMVKREYLGEYEIKKLLEIEAIKEGLDAIIEVDYWTEEREASTLIGILLDMMDEDGELTTFLQNYTFIRGRGIMYLESLDFIRDLPEFEYFYKLDPISGFPKPFFKIEYKLTGKEYSVYPETDEAHDIYEKYFQYYSDYHLLRQREGWSYKRKTALLKKRILKKKNGSIIKKCIPKYDGNDRLSRLRIVHFTGQTNTVDIINYTYDDHGKLVKRIIAVHDGTKVYEEYRYADTKLSGKKIFINGPGNHKITLNSSIHYYSPDYLKNYFNEHVRETD